MNKLLSYIGLVDARIRASNKDLPALRYILFTIYIFHISESVKFVTDFSKKTGDYVSLSATDIKVIALTYMLEVRHVGSAEHLKKEPTMKKSVEFYKPGSDSNPNSNNLAGFYKPDDCDSDEEGLEVNTVNTTYS